MALNSDFVSPNQELVLPVLIEKKVRLFIKREDLIHPYISGNKYRKLKYNVLEAQKQGFDTLLTFGGAFSNHIAAVAAAGKEYGLKTIGVIRGEELVAKINENPTLRYAQQCGMMFKFVSRTVYKNKASEEFVNQLSADFGRFYLIPEGGTNRLAVKGCEEILTKQDANFDYISTCVGTGGTISGIVNCSKLGQQVLGFPALKGDFLQNDITKFTVRSNWKLMNSYHFGGYAKTTPQLINFINQFKKDTTIPLDPVYTGKMLFGLLDMIKEDYFKPGTSILAIHTGGLQGIEGMNASLQKKGGPIIE